MSLQAIRDMRVQRHKPSSVIDVIVGRAPKVCRGRPDLIELPMGCQPSLMDWRPVVGLWVAFYLLQDDWGVAGAAVLAAEKAGANLFGFASKAEVVVLGSFADPVIEKKAEQSLRGYLEFLCKR